MNATTRTLVLAMTLVSTGAHAYDDSMEGLKQNREQVVDDSYAWINAEAARQNAECMTMERDMQRECLLGVANWEKEQRRQAAALNEMLRR